MSSLKLTVAALLLAATTTAHAAVVFMYHRFGEDAYPSTSVRLEQFDAHLEHLAAAGYEVWPLERIARYLADERAVPDRVVGITIDDAYRSVYTEAWPRLKAHGFPFTVFVATNDVDRGGSSFMSWEQMREMAASGVHFANHSSNHDKLHERRPGESAADWERRIRADLMHAEARLREELGTAVPRSPQLFAYPYGEYSLALTALVEDLGYVAFGQHSGAIGPLSDLRRLPRYAMAEPYAALGEFRQKAATFALPLTAIEPQDPIVRSGQPPRLTATLGEVDGDRRRLTCFASGQGQLEIQWLSAERFSVQAPRAYRPGRARYNCTLPSRQSGRFYWFSQPWIIPGGSS